MSSEQQGVEVEQEQNVRISSRGELAVMRPAEPQSDEDWIIADTIINTGDYQ